MENEKGRMIAETTPFSKKKKKKETNSDGEGDKYFI